MKFVTLIHQLCHCIGCVYCLQMFFMDDDNFVLLSFLFHVLQDGFSNQCHKASSRVQLTFTVPMVIVREKMVVVLFLFNVLYACFFNEFIVFHCSWIFMPLD